MLLEALPMPVTYLDRDLIYRFCNPAAAAALGRPSDEIVGRPLHELFGPDSPVTRAVQRVVASGERFSGEIEMESPDDRDAARVWIVSYVPDTDEAGFVHGVFAEGFDVTDLVRSREEARSALELSEQRFRALATASSDVVYRMSADWREMYQLHSEGFLATSEQPNSNWPDDYIPREEQPRVQAAIDEAISTKSLFDLEHQVIKSDGTIGWTHSRAVPLLDERGEITEWFGTAADRTRRRRAELELRAERRKAVMHARRMSMLRELAEIGVSSLSVQEAGQALAGAVAEGLRAKAAFIWHVDEAGEYLVPAGGVGVEPELIERLYGPVSLDSGTMTATVFRSGQAAYFPDSENAEIPEKLRDFNRAIGIRAGISLPLVVEERTAGALSIVWEAPQYFDQERLSFLGSVASEVALGIQNARLVEAERDARLQTQHELETTALLLKAAQGSAEVIELRSALERIASFVLEFTGITRAYVNLIDMEKRTLTPVVATGGLSHPMGTPIAFDDLSQTAREAIMTRATAVLDYERPGIPGKDRAIARANDCKVALFVPMLLHGDVVGHITVDEPGARHEFTSREIELVEGIASQAALVVRNAQLLEERVRQAELAEALNRINSAIHSTLDFEEIMRRVVVEAANGGDVDAIALHLLEDERWRLAYAYGVSEELGALRLSRDEAPLSEAVLASGEPIVITDARLDDRANRQMMGRFDISALVALPLMVRGESIGVLFAGCYGAGRALDQQQIDFISKVASTLSLALENARLYQHEHRIADVLQEALLTLPDSVPGIEFAHRYRAAEEAERVGGDFYDMFEVDDDILGIVVGDVAGKGLEAALLTSLAKHTIRAHANEQGKTPSKVLELTSDVVYKSTPGDAFVTVFFALLDRRTGRLTYSNAGHTTGAISRADGTVARLETTAPLLGAFQGIPFGEDIATLAAGDILFVYTDGLTEARSGGELYGEERLFSMLSAIDDRRPDGVVRAVMRDVFGFARGGLADDMAVLALRRA